MTLDDIRAARQRIAPWIRPTPLLRHPVVDARSGLSLWIKHENHNPTGAFKVRGGLNLVGAMPDDERRRGVVTASTGNHGQSIALACREHGVTCTVFVPEGNNPEKNAAMRALGATVEEAGRDFDEARERCEARSRETGARYVHSANEPWLLAGVGTYALEIFETLDAIDAVFVPIGGGSGACGVLTVRNALSPHTKVIGVGAANADAVARSWRGPERVIGSSARTFAEGLATRVTFDLTFDQLKRDLDEFVLLSEDDLAEGVRRALSDTHNLAEGAGAAAMRAAVLAADRWRGRRVVAVMSGGNMDATRLATILAGNVPR